MSGRKSLLYLRDTIFLVGVGGGFAYVFEGVYCAQDILCPKCGKDGCANVTI